MTSPDQPSRPGTPPRTYKGITVPYITVWSEEDGPLDERSVPSLRTGPGRAPRLVYPDETSADRDRHGILWKRVTWAPGQGRALFARVHATRQRRVMRRVLWGYEGAAATLSAAQKLYGSILPVRQALCNGPSSTDGGRIIWPLAYCAGGGRHGHR